VQANSFLPSLRTKPCNRESAEAVLRPRLLASWGCAGTSSISGKPNYRLVGIRRLPGLGPQGADERVACLKRELVRERQQKLCLRSFIFRSAL
jgi:hypothetical protein